TLETAIALPLSQAKPENRPCTAVQGKGTGDRSARPNHNCATPDRFRVDAWQIKLHAQHTLRQCFASADSKASVTNIQHLCLERLPCVQLELNGQIDRVPEVAPVFAFHLWDSHVQNRANSAILNGLAQHEVCPHFEGLADRSSTAYDCEHHGPLIRGVRRYASQRLFSLWQGIAIDDKTVQVAALRKLNRRGRVLAHKKLDPTLTELGSDRAEQTRIAG